MRIGKSKTGRVERMLTEAYENRLVPEASDLWHEKVMQAIRAEPSVPQVVPLRMQARIAWRVALATAAAAVIVTAVGLRVMPSDTQLAWELQRDGVLSEWVLQTGE
jgi:hypothetical protein